MKKGIIIYGSGEFAKLVAFYLSTDSHYKVEAFTVDKKYTNTTKTPNIIPFEDIDSIFPPQNYDMLIAIGYKCMRNREKMFNRARNKGYKLINFISSKALYYNDLVIGDNNIILPATHIEPNVVIGDNNIFWSDTLLCHGLQLGNHNYIAPKVVLGANSTIGDLCFFGTRSTMIDQLNIEDETFLVAGSTLFIDTENCYRYSGNPARKLEKNHIKQGICINR